MKSLILTASLALASVAAATEPAKSPSGKSISVAPEMNLYAASVPEPSHAMLLMLGVAGLAVRRRR